MGRIRTIIRYLMDDLMLLTTSILVHAAIVCLRLQELIHFAPLLLKIVSCSSEVFAKKRLLPFLKRCLLQEVGVEQQRGIEKCDTVTTLLIQSLLIAVGAYWLDSVQADISFSLWGTGSTPVGALKPGYLVLRAVILLLRKTMQILIETFSRRGLLDITVFFGHLRKRWGFLKRLIVQLIEEVYLFCWISLMIVLRVARGGLFFCPQPSLLFDSSARQHLLHFLLDFLISTKTCFLEHCAQCPKCLTFTVSHWKTRLLSLGARSRSLSKGDIQQCESATWIPAQLPGCSSLLETKSLARGLLMVDNSSSDAYDHEDTGSQDGAGSIGGTRLQLPLRQTRFKMPHSHTVGLLHPFTDLNESVGKYSDVTCDISRVFGCLSELREVMMSLHVNILFPYNPGLLL